MHMHQEDEVITLPRELRLLLHMDGGVLFEKQRAIHSLCVNDRILKNLELCGMMVARHPRKYANMIKGSTTKIQLEMALKRVVYVVAGEASGDALGRKLIRAMQRHPDGPFQFRGVGGPQMMAAGNFTSLFPIEELSVMGLIEVIPKLFAFHTRRRQVVHDIKAARPDAIVTIDSKGFCFRVLDAVQDEAPAVRQRAAVVHYVAPSIWAYKHKHGKAAATAQSLQKLMDRLLVILPFEAPLLNQGSKRDWATFVGHPAVEDFLDAHKMFRPHTINGDHAAAMTRVREMPRSMWMEQAQAQPADVWTTQVLAFDRAIQDARATSRRDRAKASTMPADAFFVCALLGSRENEVLQTATVVKEAIETFAARNATRRVHVVLPTIPSLATLLERLVADWDVSCTIEPDAAAKRELLAAIRPCVCVGLTRRLESALTGTPTIVIYRANRVTEMIAKALARVRYVSLPNIMMDAELIPELIFTRCTSANIAAALQYERVHQLPSGSLTWRWTGAFTTPERTTTRTCS
ncbi:Aste57867_21708 [Aphanomyces stellatus]|uniref:lipid-A-disaccharide synthase n=1 Tax=Aphanomyces stellatus TaxID=120398 RepID=A0A485LKB2_9STRA|nr:hypothetical protein As57867_021639 [Aphanomyces stellatus]VFT98377.1 Aste57867_21708 [Aphanomyces stellatus]